MSIKSYADVLIATIEGLFPKGTAAVIGKVFLVSVCVEIDDYASQHKIPTTRGIIHLAITADTNYVKVFVASTERSVPWREIKDWAFVCNHDSAWRDDGVRSTLGSQHQKIVFQAEKDFKKPSNKLTQRLSVDSIKILDQSVVFLGVAGSR
jgi:hypothetical protein